MLPLFWKYNWPLGISNQQSPLKHTQKMHGYGDLHNLLLNMVFPIISFSLMDSGDKGRKTPN